MKKNTGCPGSTIGRPLMSVRKFGDNSYSNFSRTTIGGSDDNPRVEVDFIEDINHNDNYNGLAQSEKNACLAKFCCKSFSSPSSCGPPLSITRETINNDEDDLSFVDFSPLHKNEEHINDNKISLTINKEKITKIKEKIKNFDWHEISDNWTVDYGKDAILILDPYIDCSKTNPLYIHKTWLKYLYNNAEWNLTDAKLGKICEVNENTIRYWRKKHNIPSKRSSTLDDHQKDIEDIIEKRKGKIIGNEWRHIGKDKRKTPFFLIECDRDCDYDCDEKHKFWINKYELKPNERYPNGKWCPYKKINKSLDRHQMDIEPIIKNKGGKILDSEWRYTGSNNDKKPYFLIECDGNNKSNEKHQWWAEKNKLKGSENNPDGSWCPKCPRKTLKEHKRDIEAIVKEKKGRILDSEWRHDEKNRKYPYFLIECDGNNERNEIHQWWIYKNDLIPNKYHPKGVWCRECQNKSLDEHQKDIPGYVKSRGGRILDSEWRYIKSGKYKSKTPFFYLECDNEEERHRWWSSKGNLLPKSSNPTGGWCKVCNDRIRAISEYAHIIIEYFSLIYLNLKNCSASFEETLDEGTRPDLIIERDENFKSNIEVYQSIILFFNNIEVVAVDLTMSLNPLIIISKCFRFYQNNRRYLLIVLLREEGIVTVQYIQELINDNEDLDNAEKDLIKVINFDEYLQFLNLDKKGDSLSKREEEIISTLKKTIQLSIEAIKSSSALEKLIRLSEKCYKLLYY